MYYCKDCWTQLSSPRAMMERHGLDTPPFERWDACPNCGGNDLVETRRCDDCRSYITGAYATLRDGGVYCEDCYTTDEL